MNEYIIPLYLFCDHNLAFDTPIVGRNIKDITKKPAKCVLFIGELWYTIISVFI